MIGVGNPMNLAAFDLPLSRDLSSYQQKAKKKQPRQGQMTERSSF